MRFPRLTLILLMTALGAWGTGALYTWFVDPEMKFWAAAARQKLDWVEMMRAKHGYVIGIVGGSTTTFGIDAEYIEAEYGLPVANLGLHFGMGPACVGFGLCALKEGDVLVLSLEPAMLVGEKPGATPIGTKLGLLLGRPEMNGWADGHSIFSKIQSLGRIQPGGYHVATMVGKLVLGQPLYRYKVDDMRPGGLQTTSKRTFSTNGISVAPQKDTMALSTSGEAFLERIATEAEKRGVRVLYLLPWSYCAPELAVQRREVNETFLEAVSRRVPTLLEQSLGVHETITDFSDSAQHLTADAARMRSRSLAEALRDQMRSGGKHQP